MLDWLRLTEGKVCDHLTRLGVAVPFPLFRGDNLTISFCRLSFLQSSRDTFRLFPLINVLRSQSQRLERGSKGGTASRRGRTFGHPLSESCKGEITDGSDTRPRLPDATRSADRWSARGHPPDATASNSLPWHLRLVGFWRAMLSGEATPQFCLFKKENYYCTQKIDALMALVLDIIYNHTGKACHFPI